MLALKIIAITITYIFIGMIVAAWYKNSKYASMNVNEAKTGMAACILLWPLMAAISPFYLVLLVLIKLLKTLVDATYNMTERKGGE